MPERIDRPQGQPTPVVHDAQATAPQLLARAADDYINGWGHPDARVGNEPGSAA